MPKRDSQPNAQSDRRRSGPANRVSAAQAESTESRPAEYLAKSPALGRGYRSKVAEILLSPLLK